jgi:hypothetical protein
MTALQALLAAASCAVPLLFGGCSLNTAPIHTGLSDRELDTRVSDRFWIGMPGMEAEATLRRAALRPRVDPVPPRDNTRDRDRGIKAYIYAPGIRNAGPYANPPRDSLYLWFTLDDRLERVGHQRRTGGELPNAGETGPLRIIVLGEGDER